MFLFIILLFILLFIEFPLCFRKLFKIPALLKYNSHTLQFPHLKCTIQQFLIYSVIQLSPQSTLEDLYCPEKKPGTLYLFVLQSSLPASWPSFRQSLLSMSIDSPVLDTSYKCRHTMYSFLCLASFT